MSNILHANHSLDTLNAPDILSAPSCFCWGFDGERRSFLIVLLKEKESPHATSPLQEATRVSWWNWTFSHPFSSKTWSSLWDFLRPDFYTNFNWCLKTFLAFLKTSEIFFSWKETDHLPPYEHLRFLYINLHNSFSTWRQSMLVWRCLCWQCLLRWQLWGNVFCVCFTSFQHNYLLVKHMRGRKIFMRAFLRSEN
jgi:hypothetical protein